MKLKFWEAFQIAHEVFKLLRATSSPSFYVHRDHFGVADVTVLVAAGREAWRVSHLAIQAFPNRTVEES